nr:helix-turn-helix domain-containing protein [Burkholderia ubonensis]
MVVQAVRDGMTQVDATRTYGVSLRAVSRWMKSAREGGLRALRPGKRRRRPGSGHLTHRQAVGILKLIIERMPDSSSRRHGRTPSGCCISTRRASVDRRRFSAVGHHEVCLTRSSRTITVDAACSAHWISV